MFATLQKIGRSLMLPIAVMPAAGLLLRLGLLLIEWVPGHTYMPGDVVIRENAAYECVQEHKASTETEPKASKASSEAELTSTTAQWKVIEKLPFKAATGKAISDAGDAIFTNLPLLFAIGVAVGFTADVGTAGMAAAVGYWVLTKVLVAVSGAIYGADGAKVDMGVLAGIISGLLAASLYQRYHKVKLPAWLAFFGGKRFVPMVTAISGVFIGAAFGLFWIYPERGLKAVGIWALAHGPIGAAVHALLNRLLLPLGLHHVLNTFVWFQLKDLTSFVPSGGQQGGLFMTGFFPIMMFGLPAAALAIVTTARPENRKTVASIFVSAAITSFVTGVTEPIEFAFMFVAPVLYVVHAILTALSAYITIALGMRDGFSFSAGLIDYALNFQIATKPVGLLAIGILFGVVYYVLFVILIKALDIPTPGREPDLVDEPAK
jgi:N-acetylglucosamine PTS system EIICBA or EIICB component